MCCLSYGQDDGYIFLYHDNFYTVPDGERWVLAELDTGMGVFIHKPDGSGISLIGCSIDGSYIVSLFPSRDIIGIGRLPFAIEQRAKFAFICRGHPYLSVEIFKLIDEWVG